MSCHGDSARRWAQPSSPSWLGQWVTFTHSTPKSSPKRDTSVKQPHLLTWGNKRGPGDQSDWSRPKEEDLECLPSLEPYVQEFLREEEMLPAGAWVGQPPANLNAWTFPLENTKWMKWCAWQLDMAVWWQELKEVPSQDNLQDFAWRVWASFQVPKVQCHVLKVDNNHCMPLAHHSLDRDWFFPLPDMQFGSQDFQLTQSQKTLAYVKALQYWTEKALPPIPSEPHQLVESVLELWQMMKVLTTITDEEVLEDVPPLNWVKIMPSRLLEPIQWEHSGSRICWGPS